MTDLVRASVETYESGVGTSGSCEGRAWASLRGTVPGTLRPWAMLALSKAGLILCDFEWFFGGLPEIPFPPC